MQGMEVFVKEHGEGMWEIRYLKNGAVIKKRTVLDINREVRSLLRELDPSVPIFVEPYLKKEK